MNDPITKYRGWFQRPTIAIAWAVLLIVAIHPPHGLGRPICWIAGMTGVPCPGCGLTRSMSCAARGMFQASWTYHPFGIAFLAVFAGLALISLLPSAGRQQLTDWTCRHARALNFAYGLFIAAFLAYGIARAADHWIQWR